MRAAPSVLTERRAGLGTSSLTGSLVADVSALALDLGVLGAMTVATAIVIRTRQQVSRPEAVVLSSATSPSSARSR